MSILLNALLPPLFAAAGADAAPPTTPLIPVSALAHDEPISADIKAMLDAAIASGSESEIATLVKLVRTAELPSADAVTRVADAWRKQRVEAANRRLREAEFLDLVKGRAELGGYLTTGNTRNVGVTARLDLQREGVEWRHKLRVLGDYQESLGITSREYVLAAYEPNWKVGDRAYVYGVLQYESDRFLGYHDRYSLSAGAGYSALKGPNVTLDLELGPAFRHTGFPDDTEESNLAARGTLNLGLKLTSSLRFRQEASAYVQDANSTISSMSALNAKVLGPLSAQLSYAVQYESAPPIGRVSTDTTSRASLLYEF